jgi:hypothetical protein
MTRNWETIFAFVLMALSGALVWVALTGSLWLLAGYTLGIVQALGSAAIVGRAQK